MDCWSILPEHLIEIIAEKLDNHMDFLSFGAVCTSWRFVFKNNIHCLPSIFPISHCLPKGKPLPLLLQHSLMDGRNHSLFSLSNETMAKISHDLKLSETKKWIKGSLRGWLFVVDYTTHQATSINPLTRAEVCLPSFSSLSIYFVDMKNVVSSKPTGNKNDCMVMFVSIYSNICYCRVGDDKWNLLKHSHGIVDLINNNGIFYAIDTNSDLYRITMKEHTINMQHVLVWMDYRILHLCSRKFLVESSSGELLLVTRSLANKHLDGIPHFEIFKLSSRYIKDHRVDYLKMYEWQKVEDVDNQIIFLGHEGSLSVESSLYPGTKGNCIYFPHVFDGHLHTAVYNLTSRSIEYFSLDVVENLSGALWFSPNPW